MRDRGTRKTGLLLAIAVGLVGALLPALPAAAHNSLVGSDPANGARLPAAPERVRLNFLSRLDPDTTKLTITGPDNVDALGGKPAFDGAKVSAPLRPGAAGLYIVGYQVASGDGHPIKGEIRFTLTVGVATATPSPGPVATSAPVAAVTPPGATPPGATASPTYRATGGLTREDGTPWWLWAGGGVLVILLLGGGALLLRRRRSA
ncbi:copper resistance CopC family protein [Micromonospora sp. NPDC049559]|uniref:copper resistance CopC family protein n=1 Tax=Micromonospora sp. NPDC049559 TaxID=3155923 RepID=UPI00342BB982